MAVANETILRKMMQELQQANENQHNQAQMLKHIEKIKLLCDLFLTEDKVQPTKAQTSEISAAELKAMMGENKTTNQPTFKKSIELDDEGNGDSIFDF